MPSNLDPRRAAPTVRALQCLTGYWRFHGLKVACQSANPSGPSVPIRPILPYLPSCQGPASSYLPAHLVRRLPYLTSYIYICTYRALREQRSSLVSLCLDLTLPRPQRRPRPLVITLIIILHRPVTLLLARPGPVPVPPARRAVQVPFAPVAPHRRVLVADAAPAVDLLVCELWW